MFFGLIAGAVLALMGVSHSRTLNRLARVYVSVMRGTPLLVQIFVIYYGLAELQYFARSDAGRRDRIVGERGRVSVGEHARRRSSAFIRDNSSPRTASDSRGARRCVT